MSRVKLWGGLAILFAAGVLSGVAGAHLYHEAPWAARGERGTDSQHERIMKRLTRELSLTAAQQAEIEPIVARAHVAMLELRLAHQSEVEQILASGMADMKARLSPEQGKKLDAWHERLERRWQKMRDSLEGAKKRLAWFR